MKTKQNTFENGQGLVEFALTITLLLFLILVIVDLGRITYAYSALHGATREGARYGIVNSSDSSGIIARTQEYAIGVGLEVADIVVTQPDQYHVRVTATYTFKTASPILAMITGSGSYTLESSSLMRVEK